MTASPQPSEGARCATHPTTPASGACTRCGAFVCAACATGPELMCAACRARTGLDVKALATAYRSLVLWFGLELLVTIFPGGLLPPVVTSLVLLVSIGALTVFAYRTARALQSTVPWVWGVAMVVPCVNAITLLMLSSKATTACRQNGIAVGLLGPKL